MRRIVITAVIGLTALVAEPSLACAHGFEPALLRLVERDVGRFDVTWKVPRPDAEGGPIDFDVEPRLPNHCRPVGEAREAAERSLRAWTVNCAPLGLAGQSIVFDGLEATATDVLVRLTSLDGETIAGVVRPSSPQMVLPGGTTGSTFAVAASYTTLGVEHILSGPDHLLFVLGLLLLLIRQRRLLLIETITAFTVGHSVTLALATLDVIHGASAPVEATIALSIVLLAVELIKSRESSLTLRYPWAVALGFGLLHGLGFAGALSEIGIPRAQIPLALFAFNGGVEVGQLLFVGAALSVLLGARHLVSAFTCSMVPRPRRVRVLAGYAIGSIAAFWCVQRMAGFWA